VDISLAGRRGMSTPKDTTWYCTTPDRYVYVVGVYVCVCVYVYVYVYVYV